MPTEEEERSGILGMMLLTPDVTVMVVGKMFCTKDVAMTVGVTVMVDVRSGGATLAGLLEVLVSG